MSSHPHRVFIDSVGKDSADDSKTEFTRYNYHVGGQCFATNGRDIMLPYNVKDSVEIAVQAAIVHERYGHGTFTQWHVVKMVCDKMPWVFGILNGFEDIMVDSRVMARYPQYTEHYSKLLVFVLDKIKADSITIGKAAGRGPLTIEELRKHIDTNPRGGSDMEDRIIYEMLWRSYPAAVKYGLPLHHPLTDQPVLDFFVRNEKLLEAMMAAAKLPGATTNKNLSLAIKMYVLIHGKGKTPEPPEPPKPDNWVLEDDEQPDLEGDGPPPPPGKPCKCGCH